MHPLMVKEIVARCLQREVEGDNPTVPPFTVEQLENCVIQLASDSASPAEAIGEAERGLISSVLAYDEGIDIDLHKACVCYRALRAQAKGTPPLMHESDDLE